MASQTPQLPSQQMQVAGGQYLAGAGRPWPGATVPGLSDAPHSRRFGSRNWVVRWLATFFCRLLLILFTNTPCYIGIMYEIPAFFPSTLGCKKEEPQWQWL